MARIGVSDGAPSARGFRDRASVSGLGIAGFRFGVQCARFGVQCPLSESGFWCGAECHLTKRGFWSGVQRAQTLISRAKGRRRVQGLGSWRTFPSHQAFVPSAVSDFGAEFKFRVQGLGLRVQGSGLRVQGSGFRVQGSGFRVQGSGSRVEGYREREGGAEGEERRVGPRPAFGSSNSTPASIHPEYDVSPGHWSR